MRHKRILLVEDDARFRQTFTEALGGALARERLDVAWVGAATLEEARERLKEGGLDAALIDVRMPDGDGLELVGKINHGSGVGSPIQTLVLTAYMDTKVAARAMEAGAQGALSKVVSVEETVAAIKRLTETEHSGA